MEEYTETSYWMEIKHHILVNILLSSVNLVWVFCIEQISQSIVSKSCRVFRKTQNTL